jgi:hypothetical protein
MGSEFSSTRANPACAAAVLRSSVAPPQISSSSSSSGTPRRDATAVAAVASIPKSDRCRIERLCQTHIELTWGYVVAFTYGTPNQKVTFDKLLESQGELGAALGSEAIGTLLREHIRGAGALMEAQLRLMVAMAAAGHDYDMNRFKTVDLASDVSRLDSEWRANARQIGRAIALQHPAEWSESLVTQEMLSHLTFTVEYVERLFASLIQRASLGEHMAVIRLAPLTRGGGGGGTLYTNAKDTTSAEQKEAQAFDKYRRAVDHFVSTGSYLAVTLNLL